jgi:hypothetical protein
MYKTLNMYIIFPETLYALGNILWEQYISYKKNSDFPVCKIYEKCHFNLKCSDITQSIEIQRRTSWMFSVWSRWRGRWGFLLGSHLCCYNSHRETCWTRLTSGERNLINHYNMLFKLFCAKSVIYRIYLNVLRTFFGQIMSWKLGCALHSMAH